MPATYLRPVLAFNVLQTSFEYAIKIVFWIITRRNFSRVIFQEMPYKFMTSFALLHYIITTTTNSASPKHKQTRKPDYIAFQTAYLKFNCRSTSWILQIRDSLGHSNIIIVQNNALVSLVIYTRDRFITFVEFFFAITYKMSVKFNGGTGIICYYWYLIYLEKIQHFKCNFVFYSNDAELSWYNPHITHIIKIQKFGEMKYPHKRLTTNWICTKSGTTIIPFSFGLKQIFKMFKQENPLLFKALVMLFTLLWPFSQRDIKKSKHQNMLTKK